MQVSNAFHEEYPHIFTKDNKRTHIKNVDIVNLRAYFGILCLQAAPCINVLLREEIWGHESTYLLQLCLKMSSSLSIA